MEPDSVLDVGQEPRSLSRSNTAFKHRHFSSWPDEHSLYPPLAFRLCHCSSCCLFKLLLQAPKCLPYLVPFPPSVPSRISLSSCQERGSHDCSWAELPLAHQSVSRLLLGPGAQPSVVRSQAWLWAWADVFCGG